MSKTVSRPTPQCFTVLMIAVKHGSYSNNEIKFQDIPGWIELNFQDFSDEVYHTSVAINMLSTIYFGVSCGDGAFREYVITHIHTMIISQQ